MLTQAEIEGRRTSYACCAFDYLVSSVNAEVKGKNKAANENFEKALYMYWAALVMGGTPIDSDENPGCYTVLFATEVAQRADCLCDGCACKPSEAPFDSSCEVVAQYQVIDAIDQANLPLGPATGDAYYLLLGANIGQIATWDGAAWVFTTIALFDVLETNLGVYYTNTGSGPGLLFPPVDAVFVDFVNQYTIQSTQPQIATGSTRLISLNGYVNGVWTIFYSGTENSIATPLLFEFGSLPITALQVQYNVGACFNTSTGSVVPGFEGCGTVDITITPQSNCSSDTFNLEVDIQNQFAWPIGGVTPIVNTVTQPLVPAVPGVNTIGPFGLEDAVSLIVVNANNADCNFSNGTSYFDPRLPTFNYRVFQAVDASFEPSALPNTAYLIVSNVDSVVNTWSPYVGGIRNADGTFLSILVGSVTRADSFTSGVGYWETITGGPNNTQVEIYPAAILQFNTVTEVFVAQPITPIAPLAAGLTIIVRAKCPLTAEEVVYAGVIEDFVETPFAVACSIPNVSGDITYFTGSCPITVPAIITEFTPTGEPDPTFITGLNTTVLDLRIESVSQNIVVGGAFTLWFNAPDPDIPLGYFTRLLPTGDIDETYNTNLGTGFEFTSTPASTRVEAIGIDSQNRAIVAGNFNTLNGVTANYIARVNSDGTPDLTFLANTGTGFSHRVFDVVVMPDDKIICVGDFLTFDGSTMRGICRLNEDGTFDSTFNPGGTGFDQQAYRVILDPTDGSLVVARGFYTTYNDALGTHAAGSLVRIDADTGVFIGTITTAVFNYAIVGVSAQDNGDLIVTGYFTKYGLVQVNHIARISPVGVLDLAFLAANGSGFEPTAGPPLDPGNTGFTQQSVVMANGQIIVGILSPNIPTTFNGVNTNGLVRLNADGTQDLSFNQGVAGFNGSTFVIKQNELGALVIGGRFSTLNGLNMRYVAIIN